MKLYKITVDSKDLFSFDAEDENQALYYIKNWIKVTHMTATFSVSLYETDKKLKDHREEDYFTFKMYLS